MGKSILIVHFIVTQTAPALDQKSKALRPARPRLVPLRQILAGRQDRTHTSINSLSFGLPARTSGRQEELDHLRDCAGVDAEPIRRRTLADTSIKTECRTGA